MDPSNVPIRLIDGEELKRLFGMKSANFPYTIGRQIPGLVTIKGSRLLRWNLAVVQKYILDQANATTATQGEGADHA